MHFDSEGLELFEADILRQSTVLAEAVSVLRDAADTIAAALPASPTRVYLIGCGDSYDAGIAVRFVWERLLGVPVEAVPAMTFASSAVDTAPGGSLVVALSISGKVSRVIEGVRAARQRGLTTVAITSNNQTPLALEPSDQTWALNFKKLGAIPGTTSHLVAAAALYELGCALATDAADREGVRSDLDRLSDLVARAVADCAPVAEKHAQAVAREKPVLLIGYGAGMSSARFAVRKMLELTQLVALWQETEEYAHDEYSLVDSHFCVVQLAPPDRGAVRNHEIAHYLRRLDVHLAVVSEGQEARSYDGVADVVYDLPCSPASLMPLIYAIPGQLFALAAAKQVGGSFYGMAERIHREDGDPQIYESEIVA